MAKLYTTGYLIVKISDPLNEKNIGRKCIPARWVENALRDNYLIIRYPEEENSETRVQVKNKEPPKKTWPFYCALKMFRTDSYEKAIEFITGNDRQDSPTAADEQPDNTMNETKASTSATPSRSGKRIQTEENDKNPNNEDNLPKKKRVSAIRSGNNLKMLILNKQLHYFPKQKVTPKKVLSLRNKARTETLETLISDGKFNKLNEPNTKTVASESLGTTVNDDTVAADDSDSINEPKSIPSPDRNRLEPAPLNKPNPTNTTKNPERSKTPLPETVDSDPTQISSTNNLGQHKEAKTNFKGIQSSLNAEISALQNLIHQLAPENGTEDQNIADIKRIEDIYNAVLEVKCKMHAVYQEKSVQLKKAFESINLFVPEIKKGLALPTIQQLKENSRSNSDKPSRKGPSSESKSESEPTCLCVVKWKLKHQVPGSGLTELLPNTGIYVSEAELTQCKRLGTDMTQFARLLLPLIFTKEIDAKCGKDLSRNCFKSLDTKPEIDKHGRDALMTYVINHCKESDWTIVSRQYVECILYGPQMMSYDL